MIKYNWLWDVKTNEAEVKRILKNDKDPRFLIFARLLFSRNSDPDYVFQFVRREVFCKYWPLIRERLDRTGWFEPYKSNYWQPIYKKTMQELRQKGRDIPKFPDISISKDRFNLALQIRKLRKETHLNQKELAMRLGVKQQFVSKLETGRVNPSMDTLGKIANIFAKDLEIKFK